MVPRTQVSDADIDDTEVAPAEPIDTAAGHELARAKTLAARRPDRAEELALALRKQRLLEQMFGVEPKPEQLAHYVLLGELGQGGMGRVYEAYDPSLDRKVAIKTLKISDNPQLRQRLIREAKAMARLTDPNVVRVYEIGEADAGPYIVMEYVEGQTLGVWLAERERSLAELLEIFRAVGRGLLAIHAAGLVHRDVKPDNIMVDKSGRVLVMDLGIVHSGAEPLMPELAVKDESLELRTQTGALMGTPYYMAPEQFNALPVTGKTDQYSFCVTLWEAVYGERPFTGSSLVELMEAVKTGGLREPRPGRAPAWLRAVLERGMAVEVHERFESMQELVEALVEGQVRRGAWLILAVAVVICALAVLIMGLRRSWGRYPGLTPVATGVVAESSTAEPEARASTTRLDGPTDMEMFELLPGGAGIAYVEDGDLWLWESSETPPTKIQDGPISSLHVASDGSLFFSIREDSLFPLYQLRDLAKSPTPIPTFGHPALYCSLPRHGLVVTTAQNFNELWLIQIEGDDNQKPKFVPIYDAGAYEGESDPDEVWVMEIACDVSHDRVAVLIARGQHQSVSVIDLVGVVQATLDLPLSKKVQSLRFTPPGDELDYLIDRGYGVEIEGQRLNDERRRPFSIVRPQKGGGVVAYSISPDGSMAYVESGLAKTTFWRLGIGTGANASREPSWQVTVPALASSPKLSPKEDVLAYVEHGPDNIDHIGLVEVGTSTPRTIQGFRDLRSLAWSPNGGGLTYAADDHGTVRVHTLNMETQKRVLFEDTELSVYDNLIWAPGDMIIYQSPGAKNYTLVDPRSQTQQPLIESIQGYPLGGALSRSGDKLAVYWNGREPGLWVINTEDGRERLVRLGWLWPIGWSADDRYIFASERDAPERLVRVPVEGNEPEFEFELDFESRGDTTCHQVFENGDLLCQSVKSERTLWLRDKPTN